MSKLVKSKPSLESIFHSSFFKNYSEWEGFDTLVVAAGVSAIQPLMAIAGVDTDGDTTSSVVKTSKEDIQRVADVAAAATRGNYVGPLISATTFVSFFFLFIHLANIVHIPLGAK